MHSPHAYLLDVRVVCEPDTHGHAVSSRAAMDGDGEAATVNVRDDVQACDVRNRHLCSSGRSLNPPKLSQHCVMSH